MWWNQRERITYNSKLFLYQYNGHNVILFGGISEDANTHVFCAGKKFLSQAIETEKITL